MVNLGDTHVVNAATGWRKAVVLVGFDVAGEIVLLVIGRDKVGGLPPQVPRWSRRSTRTPR